MAAVIGGISLVKIRAHSVLRARNIHNCGIRDWLAVAVNNCPRNTRSVSADHNVQPWLGTDRKTRIRYIPTLKIDRFCEVIAQIIGFGPNHELVIASRYILQFEGSVSVHTGNCGNVHPSFPRHFRTVFLSRDQGHGQLRPIEFLARIQAELPANLPTSLWLKSQSLHRGIADFDRITQAQHLYRWLTALKCDDD